MKKATKSEVQVTQYQGDVVACGAKSTEGEYPTTVRTESGEYMKVWHDTALKRGTSITVDKVIWENGWVDTYIVTC
jgi:hypothetical protein